MREATQVIGLLNVNLRTVARHLLPVTGSNLTPEFILGRNLTDVGRTGVIKLSRHLGIYRNMSEHIQVSMAACVCVFLGVCVGSGGGG